MQTEKIGVLGAGSWGTTLAALLAHKGFDVRLWVREPEVFDEIEKTGVNNAFLPGIKLPDNLKPCREFKEALSGASIVLCAVPSHGVRGVFKAARPFISGDAVIVSATKGMEEGTGLTPAGILKDTLKDAHYKGIVALSGPTFAKEVALKLPAAAAAASASMEAATIVQKTFSTPYFRVYTNTDVIGCEIGGALKNVIAIASGISDGLSLGHNARAALITRGLAEITRFGVQMGANPLTFSGLSGLGDLVLTCTGPLSRNYSVGVSIGQGGTIDEITKGMAGGCTPGRGCTPGMVAEGVKTSKAARALAASIGVDMPITCAVYSVLYEGKGAKDAVFELMNRDLKGEPG